MRVVWVERGEGGHLGFLGGEGVGDVVGFLGGVFGGGFWAGEG